MSLIVEDGTGRSDAESYASVEFADSYHAKRGNAAWQALTYERKEQCLVKATDYMVNVFRGNWQGIKVKAAQALDWPRADVEIEQGWLPSDFVPPEVQAACVELALIADSTELLPTVGQRTKKRVKIGPMEIEYDGEGSSIAGFSNAVKRLGVFLSAGASGISAQVVRR